MIFGLCRLSAGHSAGTSDGAAFRGVFDRRNTLAACAGTATLSAPRTRP